VNFPPVNPDDRTAPLAASEHHDPFRAEGPIRDPLHRRDLDIHPERELAHERLQHIAPSEARPLLG
jgi:hypothetical protein